MDPDNSSDTHSHAPLNSPSAESETGYALLVATTLRILKEKDLSKVLRTICEEACRVLGADRALLAELSVKNLTERKVLYSYNIPQEFLDKLVASRSKSLMAKVFEKKELMVFSEIERESTTFESEALRHSGPSTFCGIPLIIDENAFSVLVLYHLNERSYSPQDITLAQTFGDLAANAIEKARLIDESEKRAERLKIVDTIAKAIGSSLVEGDLFKTITREIRQAIPCERCLISTTENEKEEIHTWHVDSDIEISATKPSTYDPKFLKIVYEEKKTRISDPRNSSAIRPKQMVRAGFLSTLQAPILQGDKCIAHLTLSSIKENAFSPEHEEMLMSLSAHLGAAIKKVSLYSDAQKHSGQLEVVGKIAKAVGSTLEPEELFRTIIQEIRRTVPCERYVIASVDEKTKEYRYLYTESEADVRALTAQQSTQKAENFYYQKYESKRVINIPELKDEHLSWSAHLQEAGLRSHLAVPIIQDGRCIAHIALSSTQANAFSAGSEEFFAAISSHLGSAIRNATLHQTAQERATRLEITAEISKAVGSILDPK